MDEHVAGGPPIFCIALPPSGRPVWRRSVGQGIGLDAAVGRALLVIAWTAYVTWRVAMNAHRRGGLFDEAR